MSLLSTSEPIIYDITKLYIEDIEAITLIDFVFVNDEFKIDVEMINHYGDSGIFELPIVLLFNGLDNITDIDLLTVFKFPNLEILKDNLSTLTDEDFEVGIAVKKANNKTDLSISNVKPPSTKLNLSMPSVTYNSEQGNITY